MSHLPGSVHPTNAPEIARESSKDAMQSNSCHLLHHLRRSTTFHPVSPTLIDHYHMTRKVWTMSSLIPPSSTVTSCRSLPPHHTAVKHHNTLKPFWARKEKPFHSYHCWRNHLVILPRPEPTTVPFFPVKVSRRVFMFSLVFTFCFLFLVTIIMCICFSYFQPHAACLFPQ